MNIGFDLDKVLVSYPPLIPERLIDRLYKKKIKGGLVYRFPSKPEQKIRKLSHLSFLRPKIKKNIDFLLTLPKEKNRLFLISSRFKFLQPETESLTKKLGLNNVFEKMYFNYENKQPHIFKNEVLEKLKLDVYVDDDFPLLKHVAKQHKNTQFFWLNTRRKNEKLTRNITAINNLSDILTLYERK